MTVDSAWPCQVRSGVLSCTGVACAPPRSEWAGQRVFLGVPESNTWSAVPNPHVGWGPSSLGPAHLTPAHPSPHPRPHPHPHLQPPTPTPTPTHPLPCSSYALPYLSEHMADLAAWVPIAPVGLKAWAASGQLPSEEARKQVGAGLVVWCGWLGWTACSCEWARAL